MLQVKNWLISSKDLLRSKKLVDLKQGHAPSKKLVDRKQGLASSKKLVDRKQGHAPSKKRLLKQILFSMSVKFHGDYKIVIRMK